MKEYKADIYDCVNQLVNRFCLVKALLGKLFITPKSSSDFAVKKKMLLWSLYATKENPFTPTKGICLL